MTDIVERLREYAEDDHERGCAGRCYDCSCGYDSKRDPLMLEAAAEIKKLRAALREAVIKVENDRTLWVAEWLIWKQDANAALEQK